MNKRPTAQEGVTYASSFGLDLPKGRRWVSVRTDGIITGWRISTDGEEYRFAQADQFAGAQSEPELDVTTEDDIEMAFGRTLRDDFGRFMESDR